MDTDELPETTQRNGLGKAGFSLLFQPGNRPSADDFVRIVESAEMSGTPVRIGFRPMPDEGWLELLSNGLVYDLTGLSPGAPEAKVQSGSVYGLEMSGSIDALEAIRLKPGSHIIAGAALPPVMRTLAGLAANVALNLPVVAVNWGPADTIIEPRYFARIVMNWLGGGAFPALGLTALSRTEDGVVHSHGLDFFTGQELQLEGRAGESPADAIKLAIRVIDFLVRTGPLREPCRIDGTDGGLMVEPSQFGNRVWVWRNE